MLDKGSTRIHQILISTHKHEVIPYFVATHVQEAYVAYLVHYFHSQVPSLDMYTLSVYHHKSTVVR